MMKKYTGVLMVAVLCSSCFTEPIDLGLNESDPKIAIAAWITDLPEDQFVTVTRSVNYLGQQDQDYISDAMITLSNSNTTYNLTERSPGIYYLPDNWTAQLDTDYFLEVSVEGNTYTASHNMRSCPTIQDVYFEDATDAEESLTYYQTVISFQDPAGEGDGYFLYDYQKGTIVDGIIERGGFGDDEFSDGDFIDEVVATNYDYRHQLGDTVRIELFSIGESTVEYFEELSSQVVQGDNPFEGPPSNVTTNFSGGAVGYFVISGAQRTEIVIE